MPTVVAKGIDVSKWNGAINWDTVKPQIDFAIIRCGYGQNITSQDDQYWFINADACTSRGIPFGSYIYAHARTIEAAENEAEHAIRLLDGYKLDYPVFYDMEDEDQVDLGPELLFEIFEAWAKKIRAAGYYPAYYSNTNWKNNYLTDPRFEQYDHWVAQYSTTLNYSGPYTIWQYTSDGVIDGSSARTDLNYCYVDYPSIINSSNNGAIQESLVPYKEPIFGKGRIFPHHSDHITYGRIFNGSKYRFGCIQTEVSSFKTSINEGKNTDSYLTKWISVIEQLKAAMAAGKPGYSNDNYIPLTVGGKTIKVRTDCSGYVNGCLKFYGVFADNGNMSSWNYADIDDEVMMSTGFIPRPFTSWNDLKKGDIIARGGHVEIFSHNSGNTHYVWSCGSTNSVNNAGTTTDSSEYTVVWSPGYPGAGCVL